MALPGIAMCTSVDFKINTLDTNIQLTDTLFIPAMEIKVKFILQLASFQQKW